MAGITDPNKPVKQLVAKLNTASLVGDLPMPEIDSIYEGDMWFQQDGAECHTAGETIPLFRTKFPGRVIPKNGDIKNGKKNK